MLSPVLVTYSALYRCWWNEWTGVKRTQGLGQHLNCWLLYIFPAPSQHWAHSKLYWCFCVPLTRLTPLWEKLLTQYWNYSLLVCLSLSVNSELLEGRDHIWLFWNVVLSIPEVNEHFLTGCFSNLTHQTVGSFETLFSNSASLQPVRAVQSCYFSNKVFPSKSLQRSTSLEPDCRFSFLLGLSFLTYKMGIIVPTFQGCWDS